MFYTTHQENNFREGQMLLVDFSNRPVAEITKSKLCKLSFVSPDKLKMIEAG